jgi:hypothetical protein
MIFPKLQCDHSCHRKSKPIPSIPPFKDSPHYTTLIYTIPYHTILYLHYLRSRSVLYSDFLRYAQEILAFSCYRSSLTSTFTSLTFVSLSFLTELTFMSVRTFIIFQSPVVQCRYNTIHTARSVVLVPTELTYHSFILPTIPVTQQLPDPS